MHTFALNRGLVSLLSQVRLSVVGLVTLLTFFGVTGVSAAPLVSFTPANVGSTNNSSVSVVARSSGVIAKIEVLTEGVEGLDFQLQDPGTCTAGSAIPPVCSVSIVFRPMSVGRRLGAVLVLDSQGNVLGEQQLGGVGQGALSVFSPAIAATAAGNGQWLYTGDGTPATASPIFLPSGVVTDPSGSFYIADSGNNRVRKVAAGVISTVAGNGSPGFSGENGLATNASLSNPTGLALDGSGDLLIADSANHVIRRLIRASGRLVTIAGTPSTQGYSGDGGLATGATLNTPESIAIDAAGNLLIADTGNCVIRKIDETTGLITTFAGTGACGFSGDGGSATGAQLNTPWGIAAGPSGAVYVADLNNNRVRAIQSDGTISTVMGDGTATAPSDGLPGASTTIFNPAAVAVDAAGNVYVADSGHNVVRKLSVATGISQVVLGSGSATFSGDLGPATSAGVYGPYALSLDSSGNLFVADIFHHRIRELVVSQAALTFAAIRVGRTSPTQQQIVENDGNSALSWSGFDPDQNSALNPATTSCAIGTDLGIDQSCTLGVQFTPQIIGPKVTSSLQLLSNAANSPATIMLSGEVDELDPTTTTLLSSANPVALGASLSLTAQVSGNGAQPNGTVRFYDGTSLLGNSTTTSSGAATLSTSSLSLGSHSITANFTGDASNSPSTSSALVEIVRQAATVTITSSSNPINVETPLTFTAAVATGSIQPTGTVSFLDGSTAIGAVAVSAKGTASLTTSALSAANHSITASYSGDASTLAGISTVLTQAVSKWSTTTSLAIANATSELGVPVQVSVRVLTNGTTAPTGAVTLLDNGAAFATLPLDGNGAGIFSTSSLTVGEHAFTATYAGDSLNATSASTTVSETITRVTTSALMSTSSNPAKGGSTLHLSATIAASAQLAAAGSPTGTVSFLDGLTPIGTAAISASGIATLDVSTLSVGTHSLSASYVGDANYASSKSAAISEQITLATTSVTLSTSASSSIAGKAITLAALVSGDGAVPSGTVTFLDGNVVVGTGALNATGQATLTTSSLAAGTHTLTASYAGDAKDNPSVSPVLTQVVTQAITAISVTSSSNPAYAGTKVILTATLSSNGDLPSGSLSLQEGGTTYSTAVLSTTGAVQFPLASLPSGAHVFVVSFAGDASHSASSSLPFTQAVQMGSSTLQLRTSGSPVSLGEMVSFTASVIATGQSPTGTIVFLDNGTNLGAVSINAVGEATLTTMSLSPGDHTISAVYSGDSFHDAATPAAIVETVQQTTTTSLSTSENPSLAGDVLTFTAHVNGANSGITGTVSFTDGGTTLGGVPLSGNGTAILQISSLSVGPHLVVATFSGDKADRGSASSALSLNVNAASTTVTLTAGNNPVIQGSPLSLLAKVTSQGRSPGGIVTFMDGSSVLGTAPLTDGVASFNTTSLTTGSHVLTARYSGDSGTQTSASAALLEIVKQNTTTILTSATNPALTAQTIALTADVQGSASAQGNVVFLDGTTPLGTATLDINRKAVLFLPALGGGSHSLTAQYIGDTYDVGSTSAAFVENVQLRTSSTVLTSSATSYLPGQQVTIVAVVQFTGPVTPTGNVSFFRAGQLLSTAPVSAAGAATLTLVPSDDQYTLTAVYAGDGVYAGSTSAQFTFTVGASTTFTVASNPGKLDLTSGDHQTLALTLTSNNNFNDTISLACLNLPASATCTFASNQLTLGSNATTAVQLVFDTGNPLGSGAATARLSESSRSEVALAGLLWPLGIGLGALVLVSRRRSRLPTLFVALLVAGASLTLSGCGTTLNVNKTPPGTYTVQVAAHGQKSGVTQVTDIVVQVR